MICKPSIKSYFYIITIGILLLPFLDRYFNTHLAPQDVYRLGLYWLLCVAAIASLYLLDIIKK